MRKIIKGKLYDTDTALHVATDTYAGNEGDVTEWLYRTPGGAFFLVQSTDLASEDRETGTREVWSAFTRDAAEHWFNNGKNVDLKDESVFALPEEASAVDDRAVSITVRAPASMRVQIMRAALDNGVSMNAYIVRCIRQGLGEAA